jgi:hypothetical protein
MDRAACTLILKRNEGRVLVASGIGSSFSVAVFGMTRKSAALFQCQRTCLSGWVTTVGRYLTATNDWYLEAQSHDFCCRVTVVRGGRLGAHSRQPSLAKLPFKFPFKPVDSRIRCVQVLMTPHY